MKNFVILLFSMLCHFILIAQTQTVFDEARTERYEVSYSNDRNNQIQNQLIDRLARGNSKSQYNTRFSISYRKTLQIIAKTGSIEIKAELSDFQITGDMMYKQFSVEKALYPNAINTDLKWLDSRNLVLKTYNLRNVRISTNPALIARYNETDSMRRKNYKLQTDQLAFIFDSRNVSDLESKCRLIDDYYNYSEQIDVASSALLRIDPQQIEYISEHRRTIENNKSLIANAKSQNFTNSLDLSYQDPLNFNAKLADFERSNNKKAFAIDDVLNRLHEIYYDRGMAYIAKRQLKLAEEQFQLSVRQNNMFAPAHLQLAAIKHAEQNNDEAVRILTDILKNKRPDTQTASQSVDLARQIYNEYITESNRLSGFSKFDDAIRSADKARYLCDNIREVPRNYQLDAAYQLAINGKFTETIQLADEAVRRKQFEAAEIQINVAKQYKNQNKDFITDQSALNAVQLRLYLAYIDEGKGLNYEAKYTEAVGILTKAQAICTNEPSIRCTNDLFDELKRAQTGIYLTMLDHAEKLFIQNRLSEAERTVVDASNYQKMNNLTEEPKAKQLLININQKKYDISIEEGKIMLENGKYVDALLMFQKASEIHNQFDVRQNRLLSGFINQAARLYTLQITTAGEVEVVNNNLVKARTLYAESLKNRELYELREDSEINESIEKLKDKIFSKECNNLQNEYISEYNKALQQIRDLKFIDANSTLEKAIGICGRIPECGVSPIESRDKQKTILPAVVYQKQLKNAQENITKEYFREATAKFNEAGKYFEENNIGNWGLKHNTLFDFVRSGTPGYINYSISYYLEQGELDKAMTLLNDLYQKNQPRDWTRSNQELLGKQLATRDFSNNPKTDIKQKLFEYTNSDRWFSFFIKAYKKQRKAMR